MLPALAFERGMVALPLDVPLWWFITALSLAALILGIAKSGFGGGLGIIAVPLVASCLRVDHAVGVMLPILIAADLVAAWQHRRHWSRRHVRAQPGVDRAGPGAGAVDQSRALVVPPGTCIRKEGFLGRGRHDR